MPDHEGDPITGISIGVSMALGLWGLIITAWWVLA